ncbi:MAG: vitamin B12 transporter [Woeseiaceae bacterium]|jgi:vitamin B12 transporter
MSFRHLAVPALALFVVCTPAHSQSETAAKEKLDNIVVTASRSPLELANLGSATSVITREQIEYRQARYVTDLLRTVPGFAVSHSGTTGSQTQVRVRGSEANHVLVLIDGIRANDPASGDEFRWELLSTNNIERIEIVRGPQSSLWGSDAVAAVVHVITRSGASSPELSAYTEAGSHSTVNAGFNGGAGGERWSLGYALESLNTDGTNISRTGSEDDDSDMTTASLSGRFLASDRLTVDFGARVVDAYSQFDPVDFFVTGIPADADVATDTSQTYLHIGSSLESPGGRFLHHLNVRYFDTSNNNLTDGVEVSSTASDRTTISYQADIRLAENILSLALEHETTNFEQRGEVGFGDPNQDQDTSVNSVIADYQGHSIGRITWLLSARYDDYSDFENALTGRFSLAYELNETTRLRASVGTGQKAPTFIERFGFFPGQFIGNPDLKPEKSTSIEFGFEQLFLDEALSVQLTVFNQDLEDEINGFVFDPLTFLFTAENVAGDSSRRGVEFSSSWKYSERMEISASYTYTDAKEKDDQGIETRELRRPRHSGSISGNYRFFDNRANILLVADYGGSRTDIFFPPFPAPSEIVTLDSSWLVDLTSGFDLTRNVNLFARVTNLLDEEYEQVYGYKTRGRSGFVGVRVNFGQ